MEKISRSLSKQQKESLLETIQQRFTGNMHRHTKVQWETVQQRLEYDPDKLWSLFKMEDSGGEPDVIGQDKQSGEIIFYDCVAETPKGRRSLCYDREALESRKSNKPQNSATDAAAEMNVELLTEEEYKELQKLGDFDTKTSSWLKTPDEVRALGGAIFGDFRFGRVFIYHNGADSYYGSRGFRSVLKV